MLLRKRDGVEQQSRRTLKILHTADVHLDCDSYGKAEQRQAHCALYRSCFECGNHITEWQSCQLGLLAHGVVSRGDSDAPRPFIVFAP